MAANDHPLNVDERQLVTFHLGDDEFGTDIMNVKEIVRALKITKIPNAPDYIEGACNLRGHVLPIVDGRTRLNIAKKEKDEYSRVLVIDVNGSATGIVVDRVSEVLHVSTRDIEEPPQIVKNMNTDYLHGVVKLNGGNRLIMLLDIMKTVNPGETKLPIHVQPNSGTTRDGIKRETDVVVDEQLVSFLLGQEEYAIRIMQVKEIIRVPEVMKVPNCEAYIEGVVSIRNDLLPVINLRTYFGMQYKEITDHTRVLVVDMGAFMAGIMVDKVSEVLRIHADIIQPLPKYSMLVGEHLKGVANLDNGKRLIMLLEPAQMISIDQYNRIRGSKVIGQEGAEANSIGRQTMNEEHLVTFKIDAEEYGIKINEVLEINRMTPVTKIPRAPYFIDGIVNMRGSIIPALNLRKLFGLAELGLTEATRIIIVDAGGVKTGIVVDAVSDVLRFERALIEPPPNILSSGARSDYVEGVGKLNEGNRLIQVLNLDQILSFQKT